MGGKEKEYAGNPKLEDSICDSTQRHRGSRGKSFKAPEMPVYRNNLHTKNYEGRVDVPSYCRQTGEQDVRRGGVVGGRLADCNRKGH